MEMILSKNSTKVGSLFGRLLEREYPQLNQPSFVISLDDLLNWSFWPSFIKTFSKFFMTAVCSTVTMLPAKTAEN